MSYIGNQSENQVSPAKMREYVTPDGSATYFDLSHDCPGYQAENIMVWVNNVMQEPAVAYTIINDANSRPRRLNFGVALATTDTCYVIYQSTGQIYHTPPANSVGYSQLEDNLRSGRVDQFVGSDGASSNTVFTLTESALNANSIMVYVNGIYQRPTTNYTVSTTALTFTASLVATDEIDVHHMSIRSTVSHVADGSVTSAKLDDNITVAGNLTVSGTQTTVDTVTMQAQNAIVFEGATADNYETTLTIVDPTSADKTVYMPNATGYLPLLNAASTTAITATPAELNYVDGVTSAIQTQMDTKATKAFSIAQAVALG